MFDMMTLISLVTAYSSYSRPRVLILAQLGLQVCTTKLASGSARERSQGFMCARQALYQPRYTAGFHFFSVCGKRTCAHRTGVEVTGQLAGRVVYIQQCFVYLVSSI